MLKKFLFVIGGFIAVVASLAAVKASQIKEMSSAPHVPPLTAVSTFTTREVSWNPSINAIGTLAPVEGVMLSTDADGTITEILADSGAAVRAGDLLLKFDTSVEVAQLASAEARAELARLQSDRALDLLSKQTISQAETDTATAQLNQAQAEVAALKAQIAKKEVRAPFSGRIGIRRLIGAMFGPDSMVPSIQDFHDFVAHQKWFFGKGPRPQFDRWTYWERFDYFAVFWGVFMIGVSGMILWFPKFFTQFMPGWIINIAQVIHSDEALLAAGFIFTFHFFNTHFRIEKFPMDTVIFSGRISHTEMLHERKRWYDRLVAENRLQDFAVKDEWEGRKKVAKTMGFVFFGTGLILLALIIYAMVSRLGH